ncbi:hypothetical protein NP233_g3552 [Leucocoprinus birnbaumii]|uniref:BTB domain-containing protein n=1 Tax=Leucocoprinus birnbaumii TaxID=56174 RepID=A0AAD5VYX8_9AGAR|nr:hypothetical protein NP233_g3552 [Leucocoprinus birnbaumii]
MGNQASSATPPSPSRYQSSTLPDSFFTTEASTADKPPPYNAQHSSVIYADNKSKIVFKSSDGQYFALIRKDAESHAGALIPANGSPHSMVDLPESSTILRTLFEFIGARKHPKLLNEKFETLAEIAKAAEKYKVFSAMNICAERMRSFKETHPKLVLLYAAHYDYPHIFDECAPLVITSESLENFAPLLPDSLRLPWLRYHARWSKALSDTISYSGIPYNAWSSGNCWRSCGQMVFQALGTGVHSLNDLSWAFNKRVSPHIDYCDQCKRLCSSWREHAQKQIDAIGIFSETCMNAELVNAEKP